jgi:hypothetical protein
MSYFFGCERLVRFERGRGRERSCTAEILRDSLITRETKRVNFVLSNLDR